VAQTAVRRAAVATAEAVAVEAKAGVTVVME
jgi:hypothetical protein